MPMISPKAIEAGADQALREKIAQIIDPDAFINTDDEEGYSPTQRAVITNRRRRNKTEAFVKADGVLSALAADGMALVPVEPTPAMLDRAVAFALNVTLSGAYGWSAYMRDVYRAMLKAATPPASPDGKNE